MNEIVNRLLLVLVLLGINARFVTAEFSIVAPGDRAFDNAMINIMLRRLA